MLYKFFIILGVIFLLTQDSLASIDGVVIHDLISVNKTEITLNISRNGFNDPIDLEFRFTRIPVHAMELEMNEDYKKINNNFLISIPLELGDGVITIGRDTGEFSETEFSSTYAGRFEVEVNVLGNSSVKTAQGTFFCQDDDRSCDSVPNSEDVCPDVLGTPLYKGCPSPFLERDDSGSYSIFDYSPGNFQCGLEPENLGFFGRLFSIPSIIFSAIGSFLFGSLEYSLEFQVIGGEDYVVGRCVDKGGLFNWLPFGVSDCKNLKIQNMEGNVLSSGSGTITYKFNPDIIYQYIFTKNNKFLEACSIVSGDIEKAVNIYDLDRDNLNYYPTWWLSRFENFVNENNIVSEDFCPASYGLPENRGCPITNKELLSDFIVRDGRTKLTFPDFNQEKLFYEEITSSLFVGSNFDTIGGLNTLNPSLIQVEVTSSCIPTIPFSQILKNDPVLLNFFDYEFKFINLSKEDVENMLNSYDFSINSLSQGQRNQLRLEVRQGNFPPGLRNSLPPGLRDRDELPRGLIRDRVPNREDIRNLIELERLEEFSRISRASNEEKRRIIDYLTKVSDCDNIIQREDELDLFSLTSTLHLLTPVDSTMRTREVINSIIDTANQLQIKKTIDPRITPTQITTHISFDIDNIPPNTTIWQVIPKENVQDFERLRDSIQQGTADEVRVKDKDPIIGWYFGDGGSSGTIGFEIDGTGEGGSTIPIQDTLFFNYGELIINYREFGCFDNENELFRIQNISGSLVSKDEFIYSVCIAHNTTHDISPNAPLIERYLGIDSTQRLTQSIRDINLYKQEGSQLGYNTYYTLFYGRTPPRLDYSCIGSIDEDSGLFGGCMYRPNSRLWIYYGEDPYPSQIDFFYVPSHSIQPLVTIFDEISGVSEIKYCITENEMENCNFPVDYVDFNSFTQGDNVVEFIIPTIRCPDVRDCEKYIRIFTQDVQGNTAWHNESLTLLQEATSCSSQCTAQPSTGRYLASCHRISGCEFMGLDFESEEDKGTTVAELCNYKVMDSWVDIGGGFEVQCPRGPIRASRFTQFPISINSDICENINSNRIPVVVDGEEVIMNIITC